jgi:hypothetical protein
MRAGGKIGKKFLLAKISTYTLYSLKIITIATIYIRFAGKEMEK